ncbi:type II toxin-antitoxin system MqsA family antitoxin [Listeria grandensis]|uniref:Type II toxin-antitoxin system MqsA family antitoxin n=1 Tax=Listeria grandensis TaxID=1494963 RepID=A0A7X1CR68_9LIST|nr:type II toxin-antitoxin system MqsA family antitoxin [Listeria grandensis]MBC1937778.1 type II toxin-antitoxin system MqsA family antitoxin [Listeria grandensis]
MSIEETDIFDLMDVPVEDITVEQKKEPKYEVPAVREYDGKDFLRVRQSYQLSQSKFAALLGVKRNTLSGYENEAKPPSTIAKRMLGIIEEHPDFIRTFYIQKLED